MKLTLVSVSVNGSFLMSTRVMLDALKPEISAIALRRLLGFDPGRGATVTVG